MGLLESQGADVKHQFTPSRCNVESVIHLHVSLTHLAGQRQAGYSKHLADPNIQLTPCQVLPYAIPTSYAKWSLWRVNIERNHKDQTGGDLLRAVSIASSSGDSNHLSGIKDSGSGKTTGSLW